MSSAACCVSELFMYSEPKIVTELVVQFPKVHLHFSVDTSVHVFISCIERAD